MRKEGKIEVCEHCSGVDIRAIKGKGQVKIGCIGKCSRKCPELQGKVYGFLNGEFVVCDTREAFVAKIDELGAFTAASDRNPLVDAFLDHVGKWKDEFEALREIALKCGLTEELKWGQPCYAVQNGNVAILGGFKEYIALSFFKGVLLKDPQGILVRQTEHVQEGRQLRFTDARQIAQAEPVIRSYLLEAIEVEKSGLAMPATQKPEIAIPGELQAKFDENPALQTAFFALTPGRQRGYVLHFSGAKQSATRSARIEKYTQKILEGKGFDD